MGSLKNRLLASPLLLLALTAGFTSLAIQTQLESIDTLRRLQTTRSFWLHEPAVWPGETGLIGRNGTPYYWYGMGQSLLMLPSDVVYHGLTWFREAPPWLPESTFVNYSTETFACVAVVLVCFALLKRLSFTTNESLAGACALLFGTTFLHYTQNLQENNFLLLLTLMGFCFQYGWLKQGRLGSLWVGSLALGANILMRLTSCLDIVAAAIFLFLCLWYSEDRSRAQILKKASDYAKVCVPSYALFFGIDRIYQYYRFGSPFHTYMKIYAEQGRFISTIQTATSTDPRWPWNTPFTTGFFGPFVSPEKSIFLFDPLLILTVILAVYLWRRLRPEIKAYLVSLACLLMGYVLFYSTYYDWSGDAAWGDRFVSTPVEMLAMISVPIMMRYREDLGIGITRLGQAIMGIAVAVQVASIIFWHNLEHSQMRTLGHPTFVIGLRFKNIIALALGRTEQWGLSNQYTRFDPWIFKTSMNTLNFFPFLVMHQGLASGKILALLFAVWGAFLGGLITMLLLIKARIEQAEDIV